MQSQISLLFLWSANPDNQVDPEAETHCKKCDEEKNAHYGGVDIQIASQAAAHAGNLAICAASGQFFI